MKRIALILILLFTTSSIIAQEDEATVTPAGPPAPMRTVEGDGISLDLYFSSLKQGRVGLLRLRGDNIERAETSIFNHHFDFFPVPDDPNLYALITAGMEQPIRAYDLVVSVVLDNSDTPQNIPAQINVTNGRFIRQDVVLPPEDDLLALLDPQLENDELKFLFEVAGPVTDETLWGREGFIAPLNSKLTSPFGAVRVFNEDYHSVHTGWDFQADIGEPMLASSSGVVAFAGHIPLRGNYVLINHGRGVYSGYAHLSVSYVTQGQRIATGQVIGLVGSTGRSSSAHAHLEFIVNGEWVDGADFIRMYVP